VIGKSFGAGNEGSNPNPKVPMRPNDIVGPRYSQAQDKVLVKEITDKPETIGEEEGTEAAEEGTSVVGKKRKNPNSMEITLPFLPNVVPTFDDMLRKVPKLRYVD
jgi:hypothetical protein